MKGANEQKSKETKSPPSSPVSYAGRRSRRARGRLRGDPASLRRIAAAMALLPQRQLPPAQTVRQWRRAAVFGADLAARFGEAPGRGLSASHRRRTAPHSAGDAYGMAVTPVSADQFRAPMMGHDLSGKPVSTFGSKSEGRAFSGSCSRAITAILMRSKIASNNDDAVVSFPARRCGRCRGLS